MNRKNIVLVIVVILGFMSSLGCSDSDDNSETSVESENIQTGEVHTIQEEEPAPISTEETETVTQAPVSDATEESKIVTLEEAKADAEEVEMEIPEVENEEAEEAPEVEKDLEEDATASESTGGSETTPQLSEIKKQELIGIMTEYYDAKEVRVVYIPPSDSSSNGLLMVDYNTDTTPTQTKIYDDIVDILIVAKSIAAESGIENPDVSICAMTMDGTALGVGNYYASTEKTDVHTSTEYPW